MNGFVPNLWQLCSLTNLLRKADPLSNVVQKVLFSRLNLGRLSSFVPFVCREHASVESVLIIGCILAQKNSTLDCISTYYAIVSLTRVSPNATGSCELLPACTTYVSWPWSGRKIFFKDEQISRLEYHLNAFRDIQHRFSPTVHYGHQTGHYTPISSLLTNLLLLDAVILHRTPFFFRRCDGYTVLELARDNFSRFPSPHDSHSLLPSRNIP